MKRLVLLPLLGLTLLASAVTVEAQLALSANDNKLVLIDGVGTVAQNPAVDTVSVIDMKQYPPRLVAEITAPTSVVGPPLSVAITPDESLALVTAAMKIDPSDPKKQIPDNRVSVIDLKASPPQVIATLEAGKGPAGLSINRQGNLALVANRAEGTVSVFTISGKTVRPVGTVKLGDEKSGTAHVAISPDGKTALVSRDGDDRISVLSIDGTKVEYAKRDLGAGLRPYGLDISSDGKYAAVANIGRGGGDSDTVSLIDMTAKPVRVVDTITVGQTPEGLKISPDSKWIGVVVMNGSNKAKTSPFYADNGKLVLLRPDGGRLVKVAEAPIGHWSQGVAFSTDGKTILVGNMVEKNLQVLDWNGSTLKDSGHSIKLNGGSAAVRIADK
jgi:DNA-binding beta-propeller fold protein YncE